MNRKDTIESIKQTLKSLFSAEQKSFGGTYYLTDGTKITTTEEIEVDAEVYAIDDMGNQTPLDNGDYVLADGRTISIVDNKITEIKGHMSTEAESPVSDANVAMADGLAEEPNGEGSMEKRLADCEYQIEEILNMVKQLTSSQTQVAEQMMSKIEEIASEPGDLAIKPTKRASFDYTPATSHKAFAKTELDEIRNIIKFKNNKDNNIQI